tara:strand:- start:277 stop:696 length:420 start_codon:yes stop_codon:yes gene_type:complete
MPNLNIKRNSIKVLDGIPQTLKSMLSQLSNAERCEIRKAARNLWRLWRMHYVSLYGEELPADVGREMRMRGEAFFDRINRVASQCEFNSIDANDINETIALNGELHHKTLEKVCYTREDVIKMLIRGVALRNPALGNAF